MPRSPKNLDLRKDSPTYGEYEQIELSQKNHKAIYIPIGCAHGFLSLEDTSCVVYLQTGTHSPEYDMGIHMNTFGMIWPVTNPIISKRDQELQSFKDFDSPFFIDPHENTY